MFYRRGGGTHLQRHTVLDQMRFIPAGAGNTISVRSVLRKSAVYPRWRGEHPARGAAPRVLPGLSPLARGTPFGDFVHFHCTRFIPAGAGNTNVNSQLTDSISVYPRWRGELPRTPDRMCSSDRFIPAGAGNSFSAVNINHVFAVYPRWRGELPARWRSPSRLDGLSPLARGTRHTAVHYYSQARFIPAGAGNSDIRIT